MIFDELFVGYIFGALTFGWFLPWIGRRLNYGRKNKNEKD